MKRLSVTSILVISALLAIFSLASAKDLTVFNSTFELLPEGVQVEDALGKTPYGWSATVARAPETKGGEISAVLTKEKVFSGDLALRIYSNDAASLLLSSRPIPIEGGLTYAALWQVYDRDDMAKNHIQAYIEFWSEDANWWGDKDYWSLESWTAQTPGLWATNTGRLSASWAAAKNSNTWEEVIVIADAPAEAKYVTLSLWVPRRVMHTYVDDIMLAVID